MDWASILPALKLDQLPLVGIVTVIIIMILTGRLYSGRAYDALGRDRDDWKKAYFQKAEANKTLMDQNTELIRAGRTTEHLVRSLPEVGGDRA